MVYEKILFAMYINDINLFQTYFSTVWTDLQISVRKVDWKNPRLIAMFYLNILSALKVKPSIKCHGNVRLEK